jgi:hypothetical protein
MYCIKKILLIALIVFTGYANFAQKTVLSDKTEINFRNDDFAVIGKYKNLNAVYINANQKAEVVLYNSNMEFEKRIELPFIKKASANIHFVSSKNGLLVFFEQKVAKKINLFASKLQDDNMFSPPISLVETTTAFFKERTEFQFAHSEDKQKHLIYNYTETDNQWVLQAVVVNNELAIETNISQNISQDNFYFLNEQAISNNGTIYITSGNRISNKGSVEELNVLMATQNQRVFAIVKTTLNNHAISDLQLIIDNKNQLLYISGFFSDNKFSLPKGVFYLTVDDNQNKSIAHFTALALQLQNGISDMRNLRMRAISLKKEGGVELIAEKYSQIIRTISSGPALTLGMNTMQETTRTVQEFNYDEVIIFNLKTDGTLDWSQALLKDQQTQDDGGIYSSFSLLENKLGKVYIFNDMNSKNSRLMACYASSKGVLSMKEMQTTKEIDDWKVMPRSAKQISANEIMLPCVSKNHLCFLLIGY